MASDEKETPLISVEDLAARRDALSVIDVRSPEEFAGGHVGGATNLPLDALVAGRLPDLPKNADIVTVCTHGGHRSQGAAQRLRDLGWARARALRGGVTAWLQYDRSSGAA